MSTLIIGASGLLGTHLSISADRPTRSMLDICNKESVNGYFKSHNFDTIVLSAAYTDVAKSNSNTSLAYRTNVLGVINVINSLQSNNKCSRLVYISTDYVFDGNRGGYSPSDPVNPVSNNYYALTKALGECAVMSYHRHCIVRTSFCRSDSWPYQIAFEDQFTSRDKISIIAPKIDDVIRSDSLGIFHIGTSRKSVFELAQSIDSSVKPASRKVITSVTIPYDTSFA